MDGVYISLDRDCKGQLESGKVGVRWIVGKWNPAFPHGRMSYQNRVISISYQHFLISYMSELYLVYWSLRLKSLK